MIRDNEYKTGYDKGWNEGWNSRDKEIVRCKDCKWRKTSNCPMMDVKDDVPTDYTADNWFCADGKKRT